MQVIVLANNAAIATLLLLQLPAGVALITVRATALRMTFNVSPRAIPKHPTSSCHKTKMCGSAVVRFHLQVKEPRVLYGGGWPEMRMARAIEEAAKKTPGGQRVVFWRDIDWVRGLHWVGWSSWSLLAS
jgi:hypothetical protein